MKTLPMRLFLLVAALFFISAALFAFSAAFVSPAYADIELISNGDFSSGFDGWWSAGAINPDASTGQLVAEITNGGANPWDVIIGQGGIPINSGGAYTLTFKASASQAATVTTLIQMDGPPYTGYFSSPINLTTSEQTFTFYFTTSETDPAATFQIQLGGQGNFTLYLDDVSLIGPEPVIPPPTTIGELLLNGDFSDGLAPWWTAGSVVADTASGELVVELISGGANPWDVIVGQNNIPLYAGGAYTLTFDAYASQNVNVTTLLQLNGPPYTQYFNGAVPLTTASQTFTYHFTSAETDLGAGFQFQIGGQGEYTFYLDNVSLIGPVPETEVEELPIVRLNQNGYLPNSLKRATIAIMETMPVDWTLYDGDDTAVASGSTYVYGLNTPSDEHVHIADFSAYQTAGTGYTLEVAGERSHPFDIGDDVYAQMRYDALAYFYHNRSGIELTMPYAGGDQWTRPAGHIGVAPNQGDYDVPCFDQVDTEGTQWYGCNYTLSPVGGWYDAGDHGKYVVNGGISLWTLFNQYERAHHLDWVDEAAYGDGRMNIPENRNGVPDLLDEARWQMEFMLSMQAPAGGIFLYTLPGGEVNSVLVEGMAHHKIADQNWTGLALAPHEDPQPRYLYPPSTAATLNLAATAAQCARIFADIDAAFAAQCLTAAETAWDAAVANPAIYARNNFTGSGPYDDTDVSDEFYWAAAELFITTGSREYARAMKHSPHFLTIPAEFDDNGVATDSALFWQQVAGLGTISLSLVPNKAPQYIIQTARDNIVAVADGYVAARDSQGYLQPYAPGDFYPWGSNSNLINNTIILGYAYDYTGNQVYFDTVSEALDYLLGRNPNDQSYVSGYGERPLLNPHHRFWANQLSNDFPAPPPGAMSGGPNSGLEDPYAQTIFPDGCPAQKCFVDHIESWSTNEITINWNAPFAWATAFLDDQATPQP